MQIIGQISTISCFYCLGASLFLAPILVYNGPMLKEFLMKQAVKSQLKNVPEEQRVMILKMVEKNPELFISMAKEIEAEVKAGKDQMSAAQAVFAKHEQEIRAVMSA